METLSESVEIIAPSRQDRSDIELMERAQTDAQIATAKKYPRPDLSIVKRNMISMATLDRETAEKCMYALRRGKGADAKVIQGPSVRLAEIAMACYGNLRAGATVIANDGKMITARGVCHDLQNNVLVTIDVKRRITDRDGRTFSEDMQVVTGNAACSIALRNAVFKVIPGALTKPVYEQAKKTAIGDAKTLAQRRNDAFATFDKMGVPSDRILSTLERASKEDVTLEDLEILIGIHTAIVDGEQSIDEAFPNKPKAKAPSFLTAKETPAPTELPCPKCGSTNVIELNAQERGCNECKTSWTLGTPETDVPVVELQKLMQRDGVSEEQVLKFCRENRLTKDQDKLSDMGAAKLRSVVNNWKRVVATIKPAA